MGLKLAILISLLVLQGVFYVSCQECKSPDDCKPDECCAVGMNEIFYTELPAQEKKERKLQSWQHTK
uniref:U13-Theraphotoxin-Sfo1b_1 n=1 Tax=Selenotholus foelschei TaxID=1905327 RepID=A0A482Z9X7_9ARAC